MHRLKDYFKDETADGKVLERCGWKFASCRDEVSRDAGLYAIFEDKFGSCLYVGKSSALWRRLSTNKYWDKAQKEYLNACIYYLVIDGGESSRILHNECLSIGLLKPKWNFAPSGTHIPLKVTSPGFISKLEFARMLEKQDSLRSKIVLCLAYLAGMSTAEIIFLEWKDIDFELSVINIRGEGKSKGKGCKRAVPLDATLKQLLLLQDKSSKHVVFSRTNRSLDRTTLCRLFHDAGEKLGYEKYLSASVLRNSYGLNLMNSGESISSVSQKLGVKHFRALNCEIGNAGYFAY